MKNKILNIKGIKLIPKKIFNDHRGGFTEVFRKNNFKRNLPNYEFKQDCISISKKNVIRGFHYQTNKPQGHLINLVKGQIIDYAIDIRIQSKTFGKIFTIRIKDDDNFMLFLPPGVAHGFIACDKENIINYKLTEYFNSKNDYGINFFDPRLKIKFPVKRSKLVISKRDLGFPFFDQVDYKSLKFF